MKDELIALYYQLSKSCNKVQHTTLEEIFTAKISNNYQNYFRYKKLYFFLCIYKMANITRERCEVNGIEVITDKLGKLWLNERHVQKQLGHKNLPALTNKYDKEYKKQRSELNGSTEQPNKRFIRADLALKIIMDCRTDESCKFKKMLGFKIHDVINTKEETVISTIKDAF